MELLDGHVFTRIGSGSQPSRTTRSWTQNGVHYTVDTTSFASPGLSFGAMTGSVNGPFRSFSVNNRPTGRPVSSGGLLGSAFGLLDDLLSMQQQHRQHVFPGSEGPVPTSSRRVVIEDASDTDEDPLAYGNTGNAGRSRPRSMLSRLKDKLLDGKQRPRQSRDYSRSRSRDASLEREPSPFRRPLNDRRHSSYRTEPREPEWAEPSRRSRPEYIEVDYDNIVEDIEPRCQQRDSRRSGPPDTSIIDALIEAVEVERRAVRTCKKRLENAIRQPGTSSHYLQRLVDDLRGHEVALTSAQANLDEATAANRGTQPNRQQSYRVRNVEPTMPNMQRQSARNTRNDFTPPFNGFDDAFPQQSQHQHPDPIFQAFQEFDTFDHPFLRASWGLHDQVFEEMQRHANEAQFRFHTNARGGGPSHNARHTNGPRRSAPNNRPRSHQQPDPVFPSFAPPPPKQPPANLLQPHEAKSLFKTYNDRWNTIPNAESNIPYPARGLQAHALTARDSIWAPLCNADVTTWSDETVMQANAQAFFLGVVGLVPVYTEAPGTGSIEMGFDKSRASTSQVEELVSMLKKEKTRWHSDRLGRRNGGSSAGPNEALQKDERARAVFHAVCGLMESAQ